MHARTRVLFPAALALLTGTILAAESAPAAGGGQRELLKPPKLAIASPITDRFAIRGLFQVSDVDMHARYDNSTGVPGTLIDAEDVLGLPRRSRKPSLDLMFRIGRRQQIHADFHVMNRSGAEVIDQQIRFGNDVYEPGERVVSTMDLRKLGLAWTWSALQTERVELGMGLALHLMQVEGDVQVPARFERERLDAAGPFPSLALRGTWRATRRFSLNVAGNWLGGTIEEVDGRYTYMHADVQFRVRPAFALGLGYSRTQFRVESQTTDFAGFLNLKYKGPEAFLRVSF